jgi:hypothetical protein
MYNVCATVRQLHSFKLQASCANYDFVICAPQTKSRAVCGLGEASVAGSGCPTITDVTTFTVL